VADQPGVIARVARYKGKWFNSERPRQHGREITKAMKKYKFKAKIEAGDGGGAYVLFPHDTEKEFATKGKVPVKATFNGVPYSGSLIKYGNPLHMLGVLKAIRQQIGKGPGDTIEVVVWRDEESRNVEVPAQF
jgi:Domain of unknown function (DUF1905)